jgi:hypothetical protein
VARVTQHLTDIQSTPPGAAFFTAITAFNKRQVIVYNGSGVMNEMACRGPGQGAAKVIRNRAGESDYVGVGNALDAGLTAAVAANPAHTQLWFSQQLLTTPLHGWNPAHNPANSPLNPQGRAPGTPPFADLLAGTDQLVTKWRNGTLQLRDASTIDIAIFVLQDYLANSGGGSSIIYYNPCNPGAGAAARPPQCALFHELVHAYYNAGGCQLSQEDSSTERVGRYFELMAVGLTPFAGRPYSENVMRAAMGQPARTQY